MCFPENDCREGGKENKTTLRRSNFSTDATGGGKLETIADADGAANGNFLSLPSDKETPSAINGRAG